MDAPILAEMRQVTTKPAPIPEKRVAALCINQGGGLTKGVFPEQVSLKGPSGILATFPLSHALPWLEGIAPTEGQQLRISRSGAGTAPATLPHGRMLVPVSGTLEVAVWNSAHEPECQRITITPESGEVLLIRTGMRHQITARSDGACVLLYKT